MSKATKLDVLSKIKDDGLDRLIALDNEYADVRLIIQRKAAYERAVARVKRELEAAEEMRKALENDNQPLQPEDNR